MAARKQYRTRTPSAQAILVLMPVVALDTNVLDLFVELTSRYGLNHELESAQAPRVPLPREHYATFWLLALAPTWTGTVYTFSDVAYSEVEAATTRKPMKAATLMQFALDAREGHPEEYRVPHEPERPDPVALQHLGLKCADAVHIDDAVGMGCSWFLTCDKGILRRRDKIVTNVGIDCCLPSQFLVQAVRNGAPWPSAVPWPWEIPDLVGPG